MIKIKKIQVDITYYNGILLQILDFSILNNNKGDFKNESTCYKIYWW